VLRASHQDQSHLERSRRSPRELPLPGLSEPALIAPQTQPPEVLPAPSASGRPAPSQLEVEPGDQPKRNSRSRQPQSPTPGSLTLADLEAIASESNPTLVQAAMAVRAARGRSVQAGLYPNPELNYIGDEIGNDGTQGLQGAGFTQEIVTAHKRQLNQATASYEVEQARYAWEAQRMRVINDVRIGYFLVLLAQKTVEISTQLVRIGDEGLQTTEKLRTASSIVAARGVPAITTSVPSNRPLPRIPFEEIEKRRIP